jgi:hypothetical protein
MYFCVTYRQRQPSEAGRLTAFAADSRKKGNHI